MVAAQLAEYFLRLLYKLMMVCMVVALVLMEYVHLLQQLVMVYMVVVELPRHLLPEDLLAVSVAVVQLMK